MRRAAAGAAGRRGGAAFPVLARILAERDMTSTPLGSLALACAAVDDVTSWCLLAFLVATVRSAPGEVLATIGLTAGFIAAMVFAVRPVARLLTMARDERGALTQGTFLIVCIGLLISAVVTERIGIHARFGAFLWGAVIPPDSALARDLAVRLEDAVVVLLLPSFFAFTGMRTEIGAIGSEQLVACGLLIAVASLGKFGGSAVAGWAIGLDRRSAMALGILMNTRGLMELIVLNVGLELGGGVPDAVHAAGDHGRGHHDGDQPGARSAARRSCHLNAPVLGGQFMYSPSQSDPAQ